MKTLILNLLIVALTLAPLAPTHYAYAKHSSDDDDDSSSRSSDDHCTKSEYAELKTQAKDAKSDVKEKQSLVDDMKKLQRTLQSQKTANAGQGDCDICTNEADQYCNKARSNPEPNPCKDGNCEISLQPSENLCYRIYKNKGCYNNALTGSLRGKIDSCWLVAHDKDVIDTAKLLQQDEADLAQSKKDSEKAADAVSECIEDCPECQAADRLAELKKQYPQLNLQQSGTQISIAPNQPSTAQMVLAGLGIGGSLLLGGLNSYFGYKAATGAQNAYSSTYNSYVQNATREGIPFYPPNPYGGAYGSMLGGMGSSPLLSSLSGGLGMMGMGALGMGGMGMGGGLSMGVGIGMGGGYPAYGNPYSFPGLGGYAGIGGYPGAMGGMMQPGYPSMPFSPYSSIGVTGGIGIGMPGLFPNGGIFPGANGGMMVGPYTGVPYMSAMPAQGSIFSGMSPFWGSPISGMNMPGTMGIGMAMGMMPGSFSGGIPGAMGIGFSGMPMAMGMMPGGMAMGMPMAMGMMPAMGMPGMMGMPTAMGMAPAMGFASAVGFTPAMGMMPGMGMPMAMGMMPGGMAMGMPMVSAMGMMPAMGMPGMGMPMMSAMGMMPGMGMPGMGMPMMSPMGMPGMGMPGMGMPMVSAMGMMPAMGMPGMGMPMMSPMGMPGMGMPGMGMPMMSSMGMPGMGMPMMSPMGMPGMGMPGMGMPGMGMPMAMGMSPSMGYPSAMGMMPGGMSFGPSPGFTPPMAFGGYPAGYPSSFPSTYPGPMMSPGYMPMVPQGGMPGYVSGFPGIPTGMPYGPYSGPGSVYGPSFPGGPSMTGFYPSSSMYSPAMTSSYPMSGQYYGNQFGTIGSQMAGTPYYSAEYTILQAQMNDVQSRYYQTMAGAGGTYGYPSYGYGSPYGTYTYGAGYGNPVPSAVGPPSVGAPNSSIISPIRSTPTTTGTGGNTF